MYPASCPTEAMEIYPENSEHREREREIKMMTVIIQPPKVMELENWISPLLLMNSLLTVIFLIFHPVVGVGFGVSGH